MKRTIPLILIFLTVLNPYICFAQPESKIFSSGIYELGYSKNYIAKIKPVNNDNTQHILIFNSNNEEKFSYKFSKLDRSELNIALQDNDILVIIGKGSVAIVFEKLT